MTLDELLLEWSYRSEKGYPSLDSPSDVSVLKEILKKLNIPSDPIIEKLKEQGVLEPNAFGFDDDDVSVVEPQQDDDDVSVVEPDTTDKNPSQDIDGDGVPDTPIDPTAESSIYDKVIKDHLVKNRGWDPDKPIPKSESNYAFPGLGGGTFNINVSSEDLKWWKEFWELTPPKTGQTEGGTKGVGNGEISLYWLYQYSNSSVKVQDTRGSDNPDLEFDGVGVEVKAYPKHTGKHSLGRYGKDREQIKLLSIIFGIKALTKLFETNPSSRKAAKETNPLTWDGENLVEAFEEIIKLKDIDFSQLAEIYDIFAQIESNLEFLNGKIGNYETADEGARAMAIEFVRPKIERKPGQGGFLVNVLENGSCRFWAIDFNKIKDNEDALKHIKTSQGAMAIDFDAIFGK